VLDAIAEIIKAREAISSSHPSTSGNNGSNGKGVAVEDLRELGRYRPDEHTVH